MVVQGWIKRYDNDDITKIGGTKKKVGLYLGTLGQMMMSKFRFISILFSYGFKLLHVLIVTFPFASKALTVGLFVQLGHDLVISAFTRQGSRPQYHIITRTSHAYTLTIVLIT